MATVYLSHESTGLRNIGREFIDAVNAFIQLQVTITDNLATAQPLAAIARGAGGIKCDVKSRDPSEALGRIGNTIKSLTAHLVELIEVIGNNQTSEAMVNAFNSMKNKCFNVKDVVTGGSRKRRQSRKNHKNHNNNNQ